ncbi:hypothetical protein KUCAC02_020792, partial [Chaenocephalus aceratus]
APCLPRSLALVRSIVKRGTKLEENVKNQACVRKGRGSMRDEQDERGWSGAVYVARRPDLFQLCPGKKNVQPSQPRQLGYSQGAMEKLEGCSTMLELRELCGGGVMSQEQGVLYYFGTTRTWHLPCALSKSKRRLRKRALCGLQRF